MTRELVHLTERQVRRGDGGKNSRPRPPTRRRCDGSERCRSGMGVCGGTETSGAACDAAAEIG